MKLNRLLSLLLAGVMALGLAAPGFADALPPGETAAAVDATLPAEDAPLVNEEAPEAQESPAPPAQDAPLEDLEDAAEDDALPGVTVEVTGPEDAPPEDGLPEAPMEEAPIEEPLGAGPGDPVYEFVARLYRVTLGREGEEAGLADWAARLTDHRSDGASAAYGFFFGKEYQGRGRTDEEFVADLYSAMFDREGDAQGAATWTAFLAGGMSREFVFSGFVEGTEFKNLCARYGISPGAYQSSQPRDRNPSATAFVARLYQVVFSRKGDESGLNTWTDLLTTGRYTAAQVAHDFFYSGEYLAKNTSEEQYLIDLYKAMFDRDGDVGGIATWKGQFAQGASRLAVLDGFVSGVEFKNLCARYGLQPGSLPQRELRDQHPGPATFLYRLCTQLLARLPGEEMNWYVQRILDGETGRAVVLEYVQTQEFALRNLQNYEVAGVLYAGLLNRAPTQDESSTAFLYLAQGGTAVGLAQKIIDTAEFASYCAALNVKGGGAGGQETTFPINGIDVAMYQNENTLKATGSPYINWDAVAASGVKFVMVRAVSTNANDQIYEDPYFRANVRGAKAAGLQVGAYLFSYATNETEVVNETNAFLAAVSALESEGIRFDYPLVIDMEKNLHGLSRERLSQLTQMALAILDQRGYYPMLYTGDYFYRDNLIGSYFDGYDKWIAHYGAPVVSLPQGQYHIWQYTDVGTVPGISGDVDMNYGYVDYGHKIRTTTNGKGQLYNHWGQ